MNNNTINETAYVSIKPIIEPADITKMVQQFDNVFSKFKLPSELSSQFTKLFSKLYDEVGKLNELQNIEKKSTKDANKIKSSYKRINSTVSELFSLTKKITDQNIADSFDFSKVPGLDALNEKIKQLSQESMKLFDMSGRKSTGKGIQKKDYGQFYEASVESLKKGGYSVYSKEIKIFSDAMSSLDISKMEKARKALELSSEKLKDENKKTIYSQIINDMNAIIQLAQTPAFNNIKTQLNDLLNQKSNITENQVTQFINGFRELINQFPQLKTYIKDYGNEVTGAAEDQAKFNSEVEHLKNQVEYFFGLNNGINIFRRSVQQAFQTVKELDAAMTETAVVTDYTVSDMWNRLAEYTSMANRLGARTAGAYQTATLYYQQGLNTEQVMGISEETMKMARIGNLEYADSTNLMTAALRGFNMELNEVSAQRINDVYSELAAITAADTEQIATAMTKTASIANSANMEFETTAAFLSQIIETTQEAPETAGTALKTIIARFGEVKDLSAKGLLTGEDEEGEIIDVNKIDKALKSVGLSLKGFVTGEEGLDDVLLQLAERWDSLDIVTQRYIATQAAGSRQQSRFLAMMSDYGRTIELVQAAENSEGSSTKQFDKTMESLDSKINRLTTAYEQFTMGIANNEVIKTVIDLLTLLLNTVNSVTSAFGDGIGVIAKFATVIGTLALGKKLIQKTFSVLGLGGVIPQNQKDSIFSKYFYGDPKDFNNKGKNIISEITNHFKKIKKVEEETLEQGAGQGTVIVEKTQQQVVKEPITDKKEETKPKQPEDTQKQSPTVTDTDNQKINELNKSLIKTTAITSTIALGLGGLSSIIKNATNETNWFTDALDSSSTALMVLSALIPVVANSIKLSLPVIGAIMAGISIAIGAITSLIKNIETPEKKLERLRESTSTVQDAAKNLQQEYDDLLSANTAHNNLLDELNRLTEGTIEFQSKLIEANQAALELLQTYSGLSYEIASNGAILISQDGMNQLYKDILKQQQQMQTASITQQIIEHNNNSQDPTSQLIIRGFLRSYSEGQITKDELYEIGRQYKNLDQSAQLKYNPLMVAEPLDGSQFAFIGDSLIEYSTSGEVGLEYKKQIGNLINTLNKNELPSAVQDAIVDNLFNSKEIKDILNDQYQQDLINDLKGKDLISTYAAELGISEENVSEDFKNKTEEEQKIIITSLQIANDVQSKLDTFIGNNSDNLNKFANYRQLTNDALLNLISDSSSENDSDIENKISKNIQNEIKTVANSLSSVYDNFSDDFIEKSVNIVYTVGLDNAERIASTLSILSNTVSDEALQSYSDILVYMTQNDENIFKSLTDINSSNLASILRVVENTIGKDNNLYKSFVESLSFSSILSSFIQSSEYSDMAEQIEEFINDTGELTAENIYELTKESKTLSSMLDLVGDNAVVLAKVFTSINLNDLNVNNLTDSLLEALDIAYKLDGALSSSFNFIDTNEWDRSSKEVDEYFKDAADYVLDSISTGYFGDQKTLDIIGTIFGDSIKQQYIDAFSSGDPQAAIKNNQQLMDAFQTLIEISDTGNLRALEKFYGLYNANAAAPFGDASQLEAAGIKTTEDWKNALIEAGLNEIMANAYISSAVANSPDLQSYLRPNDLQQSKKLFMEDLGSRENITLDEINAFSSTLGMSADEVKAFKKEIESAGKEIIDTTQTDFSSIGDFQKAFARSTTPIMSGELKKPEYNIDSFIKELQKLGYSEEIINKAIADFNNNEKLFTKTLSDGTSVTQEVGETYAEFLTRIESLEQEIQYSKIGTAIGEAISTMSSEMEVTPYWNETALNNLLNQIKNITVGVGIQVTSVTSGAGNAYGNAFAFGSTETLTGELGEELVVDPNNHRWYTVGTNGAEFVDLPKDAIVFNHQQTKSLLQNRKIGSRGKAMAAGSPGIHWFEGFDPRTLINNGGKGTTSKKTYWENPYDILYNLTEEINEALRQREKLERQYDRLIENESSNILNLLENSLSLMQNLTKEIQLQQQLQDKRLKQIQNLANEEYIDSEGVSTTYAAVGVSKYAKYDEEKQTIIIDWAGIEAIEDDKEGEYLGAAVESYVSKLEELVEEYENTEETLEDMQDALEEIRQRGKEEYLDFETKIYDALVQQEQDIIDDYSDLSNSISDSNSNILNALQEQISLQRQIRDNTQTEKDIQDAERRLAFLSRDTSGANQAEILSLKEEIQNMRQDYQDSLIDQEIDRLNQLNEKSNELREKQIEIAQAQLDYFKEAGMFWEKTYALIQNAINSDGTFNNNSELVKLLENTEMFKGMSEFGQMNWIAELIKEFNQAELGYADWMLDRASVEGNAISSTAGKLTYTNGAWTNGKDAYNVVYDPTTESWKADKIQKVEDVKSSYNSLTTNASSSSNTNNRKSSNNKENDEKKYKYDIGFIGQRWQVVPGNRYTFKQASSIAEYKNRLIEADALRYGSGGNGIAKNNSRLLKTKTLHYASGGLNEQTGFAWLDGTKSKPEYVLDSQQTKAFLYLSEALPDFIKNSNGYEANGGDNYYDIKIYVDELSNDYDVDKLSEKIKQQIVNDSLYRNVTSINRLR